MRPRFYRNSFARQHKLGDTKMGKYFKTTDIENAIQLPQKVIWRDKYEEHVKRFAIVAASVPPSLVEQTISLLETYAGHDELERECKDA